MKRALHSLSYPKKLSCNMGGLYPIGLTEVLPGDTFQHATSALLRVSPLVTPVMHKCEVRIHHFYVPNRIIWDDWEDFITGGPDGLDASVFPTINIGSPAVGSLADHLGIPTGTLTDPNVSALPFRAYAKIWNEFYRDEDLQAELVIDTTSGADTTTNTALQNVCWEKNYFTSARPTPQKGPAVSIPLTGDAVLTGTAPVMGIGPVDGQTVTAATQIRNADGTSTTQNAWTASASGVRINATGAGLASATNYPAVFADANDVLSTMEADLSGVTGVSIEDLRVASAVQRFEENRSKWGSRYSELLRAWGVRSSDARLQRPEYLGGGRDMLQFSEVLGTASDNLAEMGGHGIAAMRSNKYRSFFEEHGFVISLLSVRPKMEPMEGLYPHWNRRTKFDYFTPEFAHIGQQPIKNKEIYAAHTTPDGVFGYQDAYDSYRRSEASFSGEFRTLLLDWHMGVDYASQPALNGDFVKCVPTTRIYASTNTDQLYVNLKHSIQARRLVPFKSNPRLL